MQGSGLRIHWEVKIAASYCPTQISTTRRPSHCRYDIIYTHDTPKKHTCSDIPPTNAAMPSETSVVSSGFRWLQRKRYQYEVTFSLYMLTPTEKFIFSMSTLSPRCIEPIYFRRAPKPGLPFPSIKAPFRNPNRSIARRRSDSVLIDF